MICAFLTLEWESNVECLSTPVGYLQSLEKTLFFNPLQKCLDVIPAEAAFFNLFWTPACAGAAEFPSLAGAAFNAS